MEMINIGLEKISVTACCTNFTPEAEISTTANIIYA